MSGRNTGRIPQNFIDDLVGRTDIVELIGARVPLKKAGREFRACCPFHDEKTPSFWVSPDKQFYHCFGCGAHGTSLGFLINYDRLSFPEAVEELASRAGVEVPREARADDGRSRDEGDLAELMGEVAKYWAGKLKADSRASRYLSERGLTPETIQKFGIGYSANSWNEVLNRFANDSKKREALLACGLVIEREGSAGREGDRYYDRFRDRVMFPIRDARGRVIAFGGRIIDQGEPKYLNSPETTLFHKGRELYGLYEVRQSRAPLRRLMVVEGYMDVVRLHQAGIAYAVATLGTATTPEHLKRAFRLVSEVVFAFDGDRAGRAAAWRALNNSLAEIREGRQLKFLFLPDGHDPDTLVGEEGREAFESRLDSALPLSEYLVQELATQVDLAHADGRARFAELARPLVGKIPEGVYRELLVERLAEAIRLPASRLRDLWANTATDPSRAPRTQSSARMQNADGRSSTSGSKSSVTAGRGGLMRQAVLALVHHPKVATRLQDSDLATLTGLDEPGADILRSLIADLREQPCASTGQLLERWRERPEAERFARLAAAESLIPGDEAALQELRNALSRMSDEQRRRRFDALLEREKSAGLSPEERAELQQLMTSRTVGPTGPARR
ncbi:MAG: DNA primase [Gammaproteobacteria bacterium]|nr:DNA primase [Gammaproteobacteria bacterium]NDE87707.1 DNA primase [Gammaproteobacteria bacterium]